MTENKPKRLLVIDDDKVILASIAAYMEDCGFIVLLAEDGDKGLESFDQEQPDVVLLDLRMPTVDGLDVLAHITKEKPLVPVIVISGTGFIQDAVDSLRLGAWDFILKPVSDLALIGHAVDKALERASLMEENLRHREFLKEQVSLRTADLENRTRELLLAKEEAEAASRAKSAFLTTMSHELRTPMNGILGTAQLLQGASLSEEQHELVEILMRSGKALMNILNDILDLSKIEANNIEIESIPFSPVDVIEANINLFSGAANAKGLKLTWEGDRNLPHRLTGDPHRLGQVLSNLLGNAVKFTESGGITVTTQAQKQSDNSLQLSVRVEDTGIGISLAKTEEIFQPFFQVDNSISRKFGGTGLGLTIVKNMVELMQGQVHVESTPDQGSVFTFMLPFAEPSSDPALLESNATTDEPDRKTVDLSLSRNLNLNRLLVVEDDVINQMVIVGMLQKMGYEVDVACNGKEAIEQFQREKYDLIFMDCLMPEMDGFEATKEIRRCEEKTGGFSRIPIIAFTAKAMKGDKELCLSAGMNNYMTKPVTIDKLAQMLNSL